MGYERIHVICFGNELHGDDGFGPAVHARPPRPCLPMCACCGPTSPGSPQSAASRAAGRRSWSTPSRIRPRGFAARARSCRLRRRRGPRRSPRRLPRRRPGALLQLLPAALDRLPQIRLIGVEAARVAPFSPGLSASVAARVGEAAEHIRKAWQ
jgi:hypothetical protein